MRNQAVIVKTKSNRLPHEVLFYYGIIYIAKAMQRKRGRSKNLQTSQSIKMPLVNSWCQDWRYEQQTGTIHWLGKQARTKCNRLETVAEALNICWTTGISEQEPPVRIRRD